MNRFERLCRVALAALALLAPTASSSAQGSAPAAIPAGEPGGPGLVIRCAKALTCTLEGPGFVDRALVYVRDGKIERVLPERDEPSIEGYVLLDVGSRWLMPGMIDLHSHIAGTFDINDGVFLANPELRVSPAVIPRSPSLMRGVAGGVTTILFIPGSATNSGGQGVLLKTGLERYEEMRLREPGSIKIAQWGNPERWAMGVGKTFENYTIRDIFRRGLAYARAWKAFEEGKGPQPEKNLQWEVFRPILDKRVQASVHTQIYQVVLMTITMLKGEFGIDVYLDHSEVGGWRTAPVAERYGVPAIVGPRSADPPSRGFINWAQAREEGFVGLGWGWQKLGHTRIGFNTDAPVVPQEELVVQATRAAYYGMNDARMETVRGLTIVPATSAGIADRVGSLEPGKDADILIVRGDPIDSRSAVEAVLIEGKRVYDAARDGQRF